MLSYARMENVIFTGIGGLGIFIYGMLQLSDGLQKLAGSRLRKIIRSLTGNRIKGILFGAGATSILQSSSITTVMLVGLLNAGVMTLPQSIGVIYGANIGTTITAQIIAFNISEYSFLMIAIGLFMTLFTSSQKVKFIGQVLVSLGFVFLGLKFMKDACAPLRSSETVMHFTASLSQHPVLAILCGIVFTIMVQSSSASIGVTIAMASTGLIDFTAALYILMGDNIGTTVTAWLASIKGSLASRRMALVHTLFNIIGATYIGILIYSGIYAPFIDWITPSAISNDTVARHIANAHTVFNVLNAIVLFPAIGFFVWISEKIFHGEEHVVTGDAKFLDKHLFETPEVAIEQVRKEIHHMLSISRDSFETASKAYLNNDKKLIKKVHNLESAVDNLQQEITRYLVKLFGRSVSPDISNRLPSLLHSINDIERISDHAENVADLVEKRSDGISSLSQKARAELQNAFQHTDQMFDDTAKVLESGDEAASQRILQAEDKLDEIKKKCIANHVERLKKRECHPLAGLVFVDYLNNVEKIGDHLNNVALAASAHFAYDKGREKIEAAS